MAASVGTSELQQSYAKPDRAHVLARDATDALDVVRTEAAGILVVLFIVAAMLLVAIVVGLHPEWWRS